MWHIEEFVTVGLVFKISTSCLTMVSFTARNILLPDDYAGNLGLSITRNVISTTY